MTAASERPLVSVVIPAFNAAAAIERALDSVGAQTYAPIEVIVVDDHSTDQTAAIAGASGRGNVSVVRHETNKGASAARNTGIRAARGGYIAFLDSDDEFLPEKIDKQMRLFEANPAAAMVVCDGRRLDPSGAVHSTVFDGGQPPLAHAWKVLLTESFVQTSCAVVPRAVFESVGYFREDLIVAEDWDLWIRIALHGEIAALNEVQTIIHMTPGSLMSREQGRMSEFLFPMVRGHVRAHSDRLTGAEKREIIGRQAERAGRSACGAGRWVTGAGLLLRAVINGRDPIRNLAFLVLSGVRRLSGRK